MESSNPLLHDGATWWDRFWLDPSRTSEMDGKRRNGNRRSLTGRTSPTRPTAKRLDVAPIAGRVYEAVDNGPTSQSQLVKEGTVTWQDEKRLIIKHGALIPNEGFKQTVAGRRKRLRQELIRGLGERGWHLIRVVRWMTFERKSETD